MKLLQVLTIDFFAPFVKGDLVLRFFMYSRLTNSILLLVDKLLDDFILLLPPVPTIASLEIDPISVAAFGASADANFPFKTPLNIQALDAGGEVITDGPDSILVRRQWSIVDWQSKHLCKRNTTCYMAV